MRRFILDLLFPIHCLQCGRWDCWLCSDCLTKIIQPERITFADSALTGLYSLSYYNDAWQKIIHQFKYRYSTELGILLSQKLAKVIDQPFDYLIPVPLHRRRFLERGFNQSQLLGARIPLPSLDQALSRTRYTPPQAQLSPDQRKNNLHRAFQANPRQIKMIRSKKILLIDDVYTTGTTLNTAAQVLKKAGAREIWGLVLAKG